MKNICKGKVKWVSNTRNGRKYTTYCDFWKKQIGTLSTVSGHVKSWYQKSRIFCVKILLFDVYT